MEQENFMLEQVRQIFARSIVNDESKDKTSPKSIIISGMLYNYHLNLYRDTHIMLNQQDKVLQDGEHRQMMLEGLQMKMRMPRTDLFKLRVAGLRAHLNTYDPRRVIHRPNDKVEVPIHIARAMNATMLLATAYVHDYFSEIKQSDYVKRLRQLKLAGFPYAGPGSLQETFNTYIDLHLLAAQLEAEVIPVSKVLNWTLQPKSPDNSRHIPDPGDHVDVKKFLTPVQR